MAGYTPGITHAHIRAQVTISGVEYPVTSIGDYAFYDCYSLESIDIPDSVTSIGDSAFSNCSSLKSIDIPNSVTSIGDQAFDACSSLKSVVIGNNMKELNCLIFPSHPLESLTIGEGVQKVIDKNCDNGSFLSSCTKIIWLPNTKPEGFQTGIVNYVANDSYGEESSSLHILPFLTSMFTVDGVKYVPVPSARTCEAIDCLYGGEPYDVVMDLQVTYKNVPLTISKVNDYAVYNNNLVKSVLISGDFNVGNYAFWNCDNITTIYTTVLDIGAHAFQSCVNTKTINVKADEIGIYSFADCSGDVTTDCVRIGQRAFGGGTIKTLTMSERTESIGGFALASCYRLAAITIPNSVNTLGGGVFADCSSLADVTIGSGVKKLPDHTFESCGSLPIINIPDNVLEIYNYVFNGCTSLATVNIADRDSVLTLGSNGSYPMFSSCHLDDVYVGGDIDYLTSEDAGYSPFYGNTSLRTIKFNDKETEITEKEFAGCTNLQNVELGNSVKKIGQQAFYDCKALPSIVIPNSVDSLGIQVFQNCSSLADVTIGSGVKKLPDYTFASCGSLPIINIPGNVLEINDYVFDGCESLATVNIVDRESMLTLGSCGADPMFYSCALDSVYIGGNLSYPTEEGKGFSPFYRNTSLRAVKFNDKETEISLNEFYGCTNLRSVEMGNGVTEIAERAFSGCQHLQSFEFGTAMQTIGEEAFSDCSEMTKLVSYAVVPPVCSTQALDDINKWECTLYVPEESIEDYKVAPQWMEFFFMEAAPEKNPETWIDEVEIEVEEEIAPDADYYDLRGNRVAHPTHGIYIKVQEGKATKVSI